MIMAIGMFVEPAIVLLLLLSGTIINRDRLYGRGLGNDAEAAVTTNITLQGLRRSSGPSLHPPRQYRMRQLHILGLNRTVQTPDTSIYRSRYLSRLLEQFPFLVEVCYWALIYWIYQLGRALTTMTLVEHTVDEARRHALQLIRLEKSLNIFWEQHLQKTVMEYPSLMQWINRIYSFVHIPGTILFLIWLYYITITCASQYSSPIGCFDNRATLFKARRRTMALSNLIAFVVFTVWPCMPPRLLKDTTTGRSVDIGAENFDFVDTVHGLSGESSIWTENRFCNQYAAMPSLHFGYALLIGVTVATVPVQQSRRQRVATALLCKCRLRHSLRAICVCAGVAYIVIIFLAIIATANHFILDAIGGALVCGLGWYGNDLLLNLLPLEDVVLWHLGIHKP